MTASPPVFTIGHSTRSIPEFAAILEDAGVETVVDVRTVPRSRTNPQYNADVLPGELEPFGIGYRRIKQLGGLRGRSRDVPPEMNAFWQNQSFHNYADYALSDGFNEGLRELLQASASRRVAIMCSEAVWWRCHRRIIADYLMIHGRRVMHLMGVARAEPATMTPSTVRADGHLRYPPEAEESPR